VLLSWECEAEEEVKADRRTEEVETANDRMNNECDREDIGRDDRVRRRMAGLELVQFKQAG